MNQLVALIVELDWQKVFLIAVGAAAGYYFIVFDDGSAIQTKITTLTNETRSLEQRLEKTVKVAEDAKKFEEEIKQISQQRDEILSYMPSNMNMNDIIQIVTREATVSGVKVVKMTPKIKSEKIEFYEVSKLDLQLEGTYSQLVLFLSHLTKVPRVMTFEKINLMAKNTSSTKVEETTPLDLKGVLQVYKYTKETKKDDAAGKEATGAK